MTNKTNDSSRLDGRLDLNPDAPQRRSYGHLLPKDFPQRLVRFKEFTGFTWSGLAGKIGVDYRQMYRWRRGAEPSGGALHALYAFAATMPGGLEIFIGEPFQLTFFKN